MADEDQRQEDQTEEESAEGEEGEEGKPAASSGGKKRLIIIIVAAVVLGGGVAFGVFTLLGGGDEPAPEDVVEMEPVVELEDVAFFDLPQMSVNLLTDSRTNRYLKLRVSLELASEIDVEAIKRVLPRIQDEYQVFLRQLRVEDIRGSAGMYRLKEGLLLRAKQAAAPVVVRDVLFKEINVQ